VAGDIADKLRRFGWARIDRWRAARFRLGAPAGALADVVDRRRLLLFAKAWQFVTATLLGVLTVADVTTPAVLLGATVVLGIGASLGLPAFSAVTVELVDREQLPRRSRSTPCR
jgi:MFS family permease